MCFVYLTQCKVKKLQKRTKKTNRCSNGSTSPHLCFHRTDIHSIRSQFRHSPQKSFTFFILNAPPYPDMGRETKANYILNFFIYYILSFVILSIVATAPRSIGRFPSRRIVNNNCGVTLGRCLTSASHIRPYIKKNTYTNNEYAKLRYFA